jgi:hypothetical protein
VADLATTSFTTKPPAPPDELDELDELELELELDEVELEELELELDELPEPPHAVSKPKASSTDTPYIPRIKTPNYVLADHLFFSVTRRQPNNTDAGY